MLGCSQLPPRLPLGGGQQPDSCSYTSSSNSRKLLQVQVQAFFLNVLGGVYFLSKGAQTQETPMRGGARSPGPSTAHPAAAQRPAVLPVPPETCARAPFPSTHFLKKTKKAAPERELAEPTAPRTPWAALGTEPESQAPAPIFERGQRARPPASAEHPPTRRLSETGADHDPWAVSRQEHRPAEEGGKSLWRGHCGGGRSGEAGILTPSPPGAPNHVQEKGRRKGFLRY